MKISKHIHSCLLVEDQGKTVLLDPGTYSMENNGLDISTINKLDIIGITHEHFDHLHTPTIIALVKKFPTVQIFTTESIKNILAKENISALTTSTEIITLDFAPHERIWAVAPPENVMITLFEKLVDPGDSLSFRIDSHPDRGSMDSRLRGNDGNKGLVLALPITAPWGSTTTAVEKALEIKPTYIIPVHDFMWKDEIRMGMYDRLEEFFGKNGITFLKAETGNVFEV